MLLETRYKNGDDDGNADDDGVGDGDGDDGNSDSDASTCIGFAARLMKENPLQRAHVGFVAVTSIAFA